MKIVCSWCGRDTGEKDAEGVAGVSYGICGDCVAKLEANKVTNCSDSPGFNILIKYLANYVTQN